MIMCSKLGLKVRACNPRPDIVYCKALSWAVSSVGRASALHAEGFTGSSPVPPTMNHRLHRL